jgi:hypothetical protein
MEMTEIIFRQREFPFETIICETPKNGRAFLSSIFAVCTDQSSLSGNRNPSKSTTGIKQASEKLRARIAAPTSHFPGVRTVHDFWVKGAF